MPPKKEGGASGQNAYERLQQREKNKIKAEKREHRRLEQIEVDKVSEADEKFKYVVWLCSRLPCA